MGELSKKLKIQKGTITYEATIYDSASAAGDNYLNVQVDGANGYIALGEASNSKALPLKVQEGDTIYSALASNGYEIKGVWTITDYTADKIFWGIHWKWHATLIKGDAKGVISVVTTSNSDTDFNGTIDLQFNNMNQYPTTITIAATDNNKPNVCTYSANGKYHSDGPVKGLVRTGGVSGVTIAIT